MKISLENLVRDMEVDICKYREICEKKSEDVFTQTNFTLPEISSYTQTDESSCTSLVKLHENKKTVNSVISYSCPMDSCISQLSYVELMEHLKTYHANIFYEVKLTSGKFSTKFTIDTTLLPRTYNLAFFVSDMGLFFYKAVIYSNGKLVANVQYIHYTTKNLFDYELVFKGENNHLRRYVMVVPYLLNQEKLSLYSLYVHETEMSKIISDNSLFACILTIKPRIKSSNYRSKIEKTKN